MAETRKITISLSEVKWYWYIVPVLWGLFGLFYLGLAVTFMLSGNVWATLGYLLIAAIDLTVAYAWVILGLWGTWNKKWSKAVNEDIAESYLYSARQDYTRALAVLNRTEAPVESSRWRRMFTFDKSLISK